MYNCLKIIKKGVFYVAFWNECSEFNEPNSS